MTSQKTLLAFAIVAVVASLIALLTAFKIYAGVQTWLAFSPGDTGNQTKATVNVTIQSLIKIKFTNDTISWGSGGVSGATFANLTSEGQFNNWQNSTPANATNGFVLENIGTINATLWIKTDKNATGFIRNGVGFNSNDAFLYKLRECSTLSGDFCSGYAGMREQVFNDTIPACGGTQNITLAVYRNVNASTNPSYLGDKVCEHFNWENDKDELRIDINAVISDSAPSGPKGAIMTAQAECPLSLSPC